MFDAKTKAGIVNNLGIAVGVKPTVENVEVFSYVVEKVQEVGLAEVTAADIANVKVEVDGKEKSLTNTQVAKVMAVIEFHRAVAVTTAKTARATKPTIAEKYRANTSSDEMYEVAVKVAEIRINAEGTKPRSWKNVRGDLGLKLDEFHEVIRKSDMWVDVVLDRIESLKAQEGGWEYNGKLSVLTGIDNIDDLLE